jgi:hypothetical protein
MVPFFETTQACAEEIEVAKKEREAERQQRLEAERRQLAELQALRRELRLAQQRSSHLEADAKRLQNEATNATMLLDEATIVGEQLKNQMVDIGKDRDNFKRLYTESEEDKRRLSDLVERNANYVCNPPLCLILMLIVQPHPTRLEGRVKSSRKMTKSSRG